MDSSNPMNENRLQVFGSCNGAHPAFCASATSIHHDRGPPHQVLPSRADAGNPSVPRHPFSEDPYCFKSGLSPEFVCGFGANPVIVNP